jgi:phosphoserine phosphatase
MKNGFLSAIFRTALLIAAALLMHISVLSQEGPLNRLNWSERNHALLNRMIADYGSGGKFYDGKSLPYIVLDWDNTCAFQDVEEALIRYQLFRLKFKMNEEQFRLILQDRINGVTELTYEGMTFRLSDIHEDLMNDYRFLLSNYSGFGGKLSLDQIRETAQHKDFVARLLFLSDAYYSSAGIGMEYALAWEIHLLSGFTADEVRKMAKEAIEFELGNRISREVLTSPDLPGLRSGKVSCSYVSGLRIIPEMQDLISSCMSRGIEVYIVSASYKPVVEVFSGEGNFGYNLPASNVIAMDMNLRDGRIIPEYRTEWVKTVQQGKVEAIGRVIRSKTGKDHGPLLVGGDSNGDYDMFTAFPDMKLGLIWNTVKGGNISKLCRIAADESGSENPKFILQGRNENTGITIPSSATILVGTDKPILLKEPIN